jgi:hypothetical protein
MPITDGKPPKINILFTGFFISRINEGAAIAEIGALSESDCHRPRITILKDSHNGFPLTPEGVVFDIDQHIEFQVENTELTTIKEFRNGDFKRNAETNDKDDFRWVLDLTNEVLDGKEVPVLADKLKPIFRINNAEFYTAHLTNRLKLKRPNSDPLPFGRIADMFCANITFNDNSKMVIKNGINTLMTIDHSEKEVTYQIVIDCHCQQQVATSDFPEIFNVLGNIPDNIKGTDFVADAPPVTLAGGPIQGGDVPCMGGRITK